MIRTTFNFMHEARTFVQAEASEATIYVDIQTGKIIVEYFKKSIDK